MSRFVFLSFLSLLLLLIDYYVFEGVKLISNGLSENTKKIIYTAYWGLTVISFIAFFTYHFVNPDLVGSKARTFIMVGIFMNYFSKFFAVIFLFIDDIIRLGQWVYDQIVPSKQTIAETTEPVKNGITRSDFLVKTGLIASTIPFAGMSYGIISGAHDYRIRRKTVYLPNLPKAFDGIKIGQLSDIHSGSFFNKTAVKGGVEMFLNEKPDVILFTGDLVNNKASEVKDYIDIFGKVKAPMGVYSVLGNHDYGDYVNWESAQAKAQNLENLKLAHKTMGWNLMMNENTLLTTENEQIALLGIENWGAKARFPKYGKLDQAYKGTEDIPVKLLLSHDPSHWDAQVRTEYPDIDIMFAGHTHGMQFGVEIGNIKWSPVQYMYEQWAGLYQQEKQYLYVNRGFGYLGFPGRIGMPPEITILELKKA
ncbi:metallophosphoesterase [Chondrinema litorale]|uniref:metallophosphoesterase n=1 Tax=Chondrinema litorale TaxID=2994555 RepID=UPI00254388B7|nr:metallophosphoesterase [Chondrinema litorale]UZR92610.1 metallophosphoesterase [Chondrinema litorale]